MKGQIIICRLEIIQSKNKAFFGSHTVVLEGFMLTRPAKMLVYNLNLYAPEHNCKGGYIFSTRLVNDAIINCINVSGYILRLREHSDAQDLMSYRSIARTKVSDSNALR